MGKIRKSGGGKPTGKKSCECIVELNKYLPVHLDDPLARIRTSILPMRGYSVPYISVVYRKRKRRGTEGEFMKKEFEQVIIPSHCGFCGKKYPDANTYVEPGLKYSRKK